MADFRIVISPESFTRTASGGVTGVIYVEFKGIPFPDAAWNDFPVVVLCAWSEALLGENEEEGVTWRFLDGPYSMELNHHESVVEFELVSAGPICPASAIHRVSYKELTRELSTVIERVINVCNNHGWQSDDLRRLVSVHLSLRQHVPAIM